jgi:1,2-phenylacetyl-CoA epoxidase catalytic subunit
MESIDMNAIQKLAIWEEIIKERGEKCFDLILLVYVNFYWSELEIIDLCAKWIPKRDNLEEKFYLVHHASDEVKHSILFKEGVEDLGLSWNDIDFSKYKLKDIEGRFGKLEESDDEIEILIGLNLYAEGVLAMEELIQLERNASKYFPSFRQIIKEEGTHLGFGKQVLHRYMEESFENKKIAQLNCDWYGNHLQKYLWEDISEYIDQGIDFGFLDKKYREKTAERFEVVMSSVGLSV